MRSAPKPLARVGDELDRARADIIDRLRRLHRRRANRLAGRGVHPRRGGFLDHFLVAALERAIAFEQMHHVAVGVAEHLHLDMARREDVFLDQHVGVAERGRRLALARDERIGEIGRIIDPPHPLAAAARHRLDQNRIADLRRLRRQPFGRLIRTEIARRHRHPRRDHPLLGGIFQPHRADAGGVRADPHDPRVDHSLREIGIFRQEAVTGMDRLRTGRLRRGDDLFPHQIAFARRRWPDMHRLVRLPHMQRLGIGVRIDRNRAQAHRPRGADDAARNLAAIGDEEGFDHADARVNYCNQWYATNK